MAPSAWRSPSMRPCPCWVMATNRALRRVVWTLWSRNAPCSSAGVRGLTEFGAKRDRGACVRCLVDSAIVAAAHRPAAHLQHIAEHAQGVDHELDLAAVALLSPDWDLADGQAEPTGQKQYLGVEGEPVQPRTAEHLQRGVTTKALQAALGVTERQAE